MTKKKSPKRGDKGKSASNKENNPLSRGYGVIDMTKPEPKAAKKSAPDKGNDTRKKRSYRPAWDDRPSPNAPTPEPARVPEQAPPRRKKQSYRPQWAGTQTTRVAPAEKPERPRKKSYQPPPPPTAQAKGQEKQKKRAYTPPPPTAQAKGQEKQKKRAYRPPPPNATAATTTTIQNEIPVVSIAIVSTVKSPVTPELLKNIRRQTFVHPVEIVVVRAEQSESVSKEVSRFKVRSVSPTKGALVAQSLADQALEHSRGEFVLLLSPELLPVGNEWLSAMATPLIAHSNIVVTRGTIEPHQSLSPYNAYRFEHTIREPMDFMAVRRSLWETYSFHKSGGLGHRWLEQIRHEGQIKVVEDAKATGSLTLPETFAGVVESSFCNFKQPLMEAARNAVTETFADWDALHSQKLEKPGPVYARAAVVRIAENLGKSRWRKLFIK